MINKVQILTKTIEKEINYLNVHNFKANLLCVELCYYQLKLGNLLCRESSRFSIYKDIRRGRI